MRDNDVRRMAARFFWDSVLASPALRNKLDTCPDCSRDCQEGLHNSTVLLVMEDTNGQPLSLGSGFFVRESGSVSVGDVDDSVGRLLADIGRQGNAADVGPRGQQISTLVTPVPRVATVNGGHDA